MKESALFEAFASELIARPVTPVASVERALTALVERGSRAWPGLGVEANVFVAYIAKRLPESSDILAALEDLPAEDLYLACACSQQNSDAFALLEKNFFPDARRAIANVVKNKTQAEEVEQRLRAKLLVPEADKPGKIADYLGRGPLLSWLCAAGIREALFVRRTDLRAQPPAIDEPILLAPIKGPEMELMRAQFGAHFRPAVEAAIKSLSVRDRNVLRHYLVDGLNVGQIGTIYNVHRATVARWIALARQQILDETRAILSRTMGLGPDSLDSFLRLGESQLDVSMMTLLGE